VKTARPDRRAEPAAFEWQLFFWLALFVFFAALLWLLSPILLPFIAGMAIAYVLAPLCDRLERLGLSRFLAALLAVILFVLAFVLLLLLIMPILASQLSAFIENIPEYIRRVQALLADSITPWLRSIARDDKTVGDLVSQGAGWLAGFLTSLWSGGATLISVLSLVVITPVVAYYLLHDWPRMIATADDWVPLPYRETARQLAREIDVVIAGFVRGQSAVCLILGVFYAVALSLTGLNFALLIGLVSGLISFIPYVGSMTGLVLSGGIALAQFWPDWTMIVLVIGIFLFGQFIEGNVLAPKLLGESVGLHPVWLMFALFAFGYLFGFVGLLLAGPLAAAIGVLARYALRRYHEGPLYTGEGTG
jgi:predicted PurR-regulated permease PerM